MNSIVPTIKGYYLLHQTNDQKDNAVTSLKNLNQDENLKSQLPLIDTEKVTKLLSSGIGLLDVQNSRIEESKQLTEPEQTSQSSKATPTWRFLNKIRAAKSNDELQIPNDKTVVITNRKTIWKILEAIRGPDLGCITLKVKIHKNESLNGKNNIGLKYKDEEASKKYFALKETRQAIGLQFNSLMLKAQGQQLEYTLFSIHQLVVGNFCFLYESEVDAIEQNGDLLELKVDSRQTEIQNAFHSYQQIPSLRFSQMKADFETVSSNFINQIIQGELGNVNHFLYGWPKKRCKTMTGKKFPCLPGKVFTKEAKSLKLFGELLYDSGLLSDNFYPTTTGGMIFKLRRCNNIIQLKTDQAVEAPTLDLKTRSFRNAVIGTCLEDMNI